MYSWLGEAHVHIRRDLRCAKVRVGNECAVLYAWVI
jgi:hypothetical protein